MYKVLKNKKISPNSYLMEIKAPLAIKNALPGQFIIVMAKEDSERIPLTIYDYDINKGILYFINIARNLSVSSITLLSINRP